MPSRHSSLAIDSPVRSPRRSQSSRGAKDSPRASTSSSSRIRTPTKQHRRAICESDLDDSDDEAHSPPRSSKKDKEADRTKSNGKGKASRRDEDEDDPDELISDTNDDEDDDEEEEEYEIESILRHKLDKKTGAWQFLVHWAGYSSDWDTWEPEVRLPYCADGVALRSLLTHDPLHRARRTTSKLQQMRSSRLTGRR
ncbi:hypothetical protein BDZ90DRAFT_1211 [Jaminaea rosea]|uniref:Chromo domain-containing protein n=1 Tax=Jaminaea rosea TaxID=1569628 RepID=A0A316UXA5_9BASI|nr:hypothetical protein BDZ90DRAFT_1211 [Jaminaea rosea]PWN29936.1 hypothetical protein BDZ90DRAFT_1211 [Jaminaea rosea]